jgi:small conductance mechanosensitive channel
MLPSATPAYSIVLLDKLLAYVPKLISGGIVFILFFVLYLICAFSFRRILKRYQSAHHGPVIVLLRHVVCIGVMIIGIISALGTMGVNVSALVAAAGLTGFGLSYAFKDLLSNVIAGVMIILYRPFSLGSHVSIKSCEGKIKAITLRYLTIRSENEDFLIPNSVVLTEAVTLFHKKPA